MKRPLGLAVGMAELGCAACGAALLAVGLGQALKIERAEAASYRAPIELAPLREVAVDAEPVAEPTFFELAQLPRARRAPLAALAVAAPEPPALPEPDAAFRMALRTARAALERCYEGELKKQAAFSGVVVVSVQVAMDGRVEGVQVLDAERKTSPVAACIAARLRQLRLPPVSSEAELVVPIRLSAIDGPAMPSP